MTDTSGLHPGFLPIGRRDAIADRLRGRFLFLDAIRGVAAVLIALFHFNNQWFSPTYREFSALLPAPLLTLWRHFDLGVDIFFLISGFVIAHSLWGKRVDARFVGNFILRFMTRLSPPYWAVLFVTMAWPYFVFPTLVVGFFNQFGGWRGLLTNMFYLPDLLGRPRMVPVAWTIFLEAQFYLAYIALLWLGDVCGRRSAKLGRAVIAVSFALLLVASIAHWYRLGSMDFPGRWWTFAIGATVYASVRQCWPIVALPLIVATLGAMALWRHDGRMGVVAVAGATIYLSATLGTLQTWLGWSPLTYLGRVSYSLFLVHIPIGIATLDIVQRFGDRSSTSVVTGVVLALIVSLMVADVLNRAIEMPAARLSQRLRNQREESGHR